MKKASKYSPEELLTPVLQKLLPGYRKKHKDWREKHPKTEEAKQKALALLRSVDTGYKGPLENISGNFREYIYGRVEDRYQDQKDERNGR